MSQTVQARQTAELVFPGAMIGLVSGTVAGGIAAIGGLPASYVLATTLALGVPLALFGMGYDLLLAAGRIRLGGVAPAALYWLVAFPLARALHEILFDVVSGRPIGLPDAVVPFLVYQAILSVGFAIGFIWLHEYVFPRWWIRVRGHNPVAARYVEQYTAQAARTTRRKKA
jgi:hypothetical protein